MAIVICEYMILLIQSLIIKNNISQYQSWIGKFYSWGKRTGKSIVRCVLQMKEGGGLFRLDLQWWKLMMYEIAITKMGIYIFPVIIDSSLC